MLLTGRLKSSVTTASQSLLIWQVIGYIVREAVNEVHEALTANKVIKVALDWVKFQLQWRSVGWYAGVNISRSGQWSHTIIHCQSSRD